MSTKVINYSNLQNLSLGKIASLIIGSMLIIFAMYQAAAFPSFSFEILAILTSLFILQLLNKFSWLIFLPACLILFDFSAFSGRFIFNELDFFLLITIGTALITNQFQQKISLNLFSLLPFTLTALTLVSINLSELWNNINEPLMQNPYYSSLYGFKVAKGILYGLVLALLFSSQYKANNTTLIKSLIIGSWLGSFILFLIILWERQTLVPLLNMQPWWAIASSLLDFTSAYRVTGLLSDMHTGGEAIDGLFLLLVPLNFFGFYWFERNSLRFISLLALFMICYCIMVGFTRATYFSMAISLLAFTILFQFLINRNIKVSPLNITIYLILLASSYAIFINAGYFGIISFGAIVFLGFIGKWLQNKKKLSSLLFTLIYTVLCIFISSLAIKNHFDSRWVTQSTSGFILLVCGLITTTSLTYILTKTQKELLLSNSILRASGLSIIAFMLAVALGGSQISTRMATISSDIQIRLDHWQSIVDSSGGSTLTTLIGNGIGTMPLNYVIAHPETVEKVGSFTIKDEQLILGIGDDLAFGQRIKINPNTDYSISMNVSSQKPSRLSIFLCERNVIFASNFVANCSAKTIPIESNVSEIITTVINSGNVGLQGNSLMHWPTLLYFKNTGKNSAVTIDNITLTPKESATSLLKNASFAQGLDHWFFYNDFQHLPWHIKNIYLSIYYQLGLLGAFIILLMLMKTVKVDRDDIVKTALQVFLMSYFLGIFSFGLFGDPLDSARANIFFFMLLFTVQFIGPIQKIDSKI